MKQYLVGRCCGGTMEDPDFHYEEYEIIKASSPKEAEAIYMVKHDCSYYYATSRGEVINGFVKIPVRDFVTT